MPGRKITRRSLLAMAGAATGAAGAAQLSGSGDGNLFGGTMALQEAYNVSGDLWIGPNSALNTVSADTGRVYIASDAQVWYWGDAGSWVKMGVGSASEPVPEVTTEQLSTRTRRTHSVVYIAENGDYVAVSHDNDGELERDSNDVAPVLQAAIEQPSFIGGESSVGVQIAPGYYYATGGQVNNSRSFSLYGAGRNRSIIFNNAGLDGGLITDAGNNPGAITEIWHMKFTGDQTTWNHFRLSNSREFMAFFSEFRSTEFAGMNITSPGQLATLINCWFLDTGNNAGFKAQTIREYQISNCWFQGDLQLQGADDVTVIGCRFDGDTQIGHIDIPMNSSNNVTISDSIFVNESGATNPLVNLRSGPASPTDKNIKVTDNIFRDDTGNSVTAVDIAQNVTGVEVTGNTFDPTVTPINRASGATAIVHNNKGYKTENGGEASVSDTDTIAHGLAETPTVYSAEATADKHIAVVTAVDGTNLTIGLHDDTGSAVTSDETVSWWVKASSEFEN